MQLVVCQLVFREIALQTEGTITANVQDFVNNNISTKDFFLLCPEFFISIYTAFQSSKL